MTDNQPPSYKQELKLSIWLLLFSALFPKVLLSVDGMESLRIAIAYLCGLLYVGSGTFLFWRYCRPNRVWKEKSRAMSALFVTVLGSIFCMLPLVIGDYVGPMNDARRAFLHVFMVHAKFTVLGGIYLGILATILLVQVVNEA